MISARAPALVFPLRWFSIPQCFRYERAQKGRKREHFQWNMDIVGLAGVAAEFELMSAQATFLREVGLRIAQDHADVKFRVSNRQVLEHFAAARGITGEQFLAVCVAVDKRDKIGAAATVALLVEYGIASDIAHEIVELLNIRGLDQLRSVVGNDNPGYSSLAELIELSRGGDFAGAVQVDLSVVRGLSYYTGTVWEIFDSTGSVGRAIAGGGRYDRLMETLGGKPTPMAGFGFGDIVITLVLSERGLLPATRHDVDDVVFPMRQAQFGVATLLASSLRARGRTVIVDYTEQRFRNIVKRFQDLHAQRLVVIGEDEVAAGAAKVIEFVGEERKETVLPLAGFDAETMRTLGGHRPHSAGAAEPPPALGSRRDPR
jgi:histidyl-tRNA synthetase